MSVTLNRDDPFRWILDVAAAIVSSTGKKQSLGGVAKAIGEAMNVTSIAIQAYDAERDALAEVAHWNSDGADDLDLGPVGKAAVHGTHGGFQRLVNRRQVVELHGGDPELAPEERAALSERGCKTLLQAPLTIGTDVVGVLSAGESRYQRTFMTMERERFEQLAGLAAAAIRNQGVFRREQIQSRRLDALLAVSRALTGTAGPDDVFREAIAALADGLGAAWAALYGEAGRNDGAPSLLAWYTSVGGVAQGGPPEWLAGLGDVMRDVTPSVVTTLDSGVDDELRAQMLRGRESTRLYAPLVFQGKPLGLLLLAWQGAHVGLDADELEFAQATAEMLAATFENVNLERTLR